MTVAFLAFAPVATSAATYTYDFDFTFDQTGDDRTVTGYSNDGPGGDLTGFFTIDDSLNIVDFDFDFNIRQYRIVSSTGVLIQDTRNDIVSLDIDDNDRSSTSIAPASGGNPEFTTFGFSEIDGLVQCSFRNKSGSPFSLSFTAANFSAGDATTSFRAVSTRASPYCNQFGALMFDTRPASGERQFSGSVTGTLRSDDTSVSAVPLPAAGWMLLSALAGVVTFGRRRTPRA